MQLKECIYSSFGLINRDCTCYPGLANCAIYGVYLESEIPINLIGKIDDYCEGSILDIFERTRYEVANGNLLELLSEIETSAQTGRIGKTQGNKKVTPVSRYMGLKITLNTTGNIKDLLLIASQGNTTVHLIDASDNTVVYTESIVANSRKAVNWRLQAGTYYLVTDDQGLKIENNEIKCGTCGNAPKPPSCVSVEGVRADSLTGAFIPTGTTNANGLSLNIECCCDIESVLCAVDRCDAPPALKWSAWHYSATLVAIARKILRSSKAMKSVTCSAEFLEALIKEETVKAEKAKADLISILPSYLSCVKCKTPARIAFNFK